MDLVSSRDGRREAGKGRDIEQSARSARCEYESLKMQRRGSAGAGKL